MDWKDLPQHIIDANPEAAELIRRSRSRVRLANEPRKLAPADAAPMLAAGMKLVDVSGLYPAQAEYEFNPVRGWRFDFAWPTVSIAAEVDGGRWSVGGGHHASDEDRDKMNGAATAGWVVFHFSPQQLEADPLGCASMVLSAVQAAQEALDL